MQEGKGIYTTGSTALDGWISGLAPGDNVVWRVDDVDEYAPYAETLAESCDDPGCRVTYFRFADHKPLLSRGSRATWVELFPANGFESFITHIHAHIRSSRPGDIFIFDALSGLTDTRYSDRMIGNFFRLTCPYVLRKGALAYFGIYRHLHSHHAVVPVEETTQLLIDVFVEHERRYLQLYKYERSGKTEFSSRLFREEEGELSPVEESGEISRVLHSARWEGLRSASYRMVGLWDRVFLKAESIMERVARGELPVEELRDSFEHLLTLLAPKDERMLELAREYLSLEDLLWIWRRMIGTGMIGGKAMGMLVARAIIRRDDPEVAALLEPHDSFFIGSDVFYTYMVENDCWWEWQAQKERLETPRNNETLRERILHGTFPQYIVQRFSELLSYYGDSPVIIRSSSLLEDSYGNAFSGKYDSVFSVNQGAGSKRLADFMEAIRHIYAGAISSDALEYRKRRGVLDKDEQMAILVQRVSGKRQGPYFLPHLAGVGYSFNPFRWSTDIDPNAGVLRVVLGLGTRAVDRHDDDYTRIVALNVPDRRPESGFSEVTRVAQRKADILDLRRDSVSSVHTLDLVPHIDEEARRLLCIRDRRKESQLSESSIPAGPQWVVTFDGVVRNTSVMATMRSLLSTLRKAYRSQVDVEFTVNLLDGNRFEINLVQCRTFQIQNLRGTDEASSLARVLEEEDIEGIGNGADAGKGARSGPERGTAESSGTLTPKALLIDTSGPLIGHGRFMEIELLLYVSPEEYGALAERDRYALARRIGAFIHHAPDRGERMLLIGPGRWGTSTPSLGIPVTFNEIDRAHIICEVEATHNGLTPDLSLGTHFFNDLVETNILYVACRRGPEGGFVNHALLKALTSRREGLLRVLESGLLGGADSAARDSGAPEAAALFGGRILAVGSAEEQRFRLYALNPDKKRAAR
ncbi:MAG: PEP/pyruvate-binding domain-containing protein [Spirochaetaceae bacterium]